MTPILGSWTIAVVAPITGIHPKRILLFSFISITLYGVITALAIASGMNWLSDREFVYSDLISSKSLYNTNVY
ncbi:MAG: hypothetical protein NW224_23765 [Leptolyngbyaceae cyanobacterium bins.302]|nr:hypothetical protein [Leptolyngbyaceae cyanobacterium bins.302]